MCGALDAHYVPTKASGNFIDRLTLWPSLRFAQDDIMARLSVFRVQRDEAVA
jgi:hypothetical protein